MIEIFVTVKHRGKNYQMNVIAHKGITGEEIKLLAEKQVLKQLSK